VAAPFPLSLSLSLSVFQLLFLSAAGSSAAAAANAASEVCCSPAWVSVWITLAVFPPAIAAFDFTEAKVASFSFSFTPKLLFCTAATALATAEGFLPSLSTAFADGDAGASPFAAVAAAADD
jgi:hypothetical protein